MLKKNFYRAVKSRDSHIFNGIKFQPFSISHTSACHQQLSTSSSACSTSVCNYSDCWEFSLFFGQLKLPPQTSYGPVTLRFMRPDVSTNDRQLISTDGKKGEFAGVNEWGRVNQDGPVSASPSRPGLQIMHTYPLAALFRDCLFLFFFSLLFIKGR